jgi:hypothetical protein
MDLARRLENFQRRHLNNRLITSGILSTDMEDNNEEVFVEEFAIKSYTGIKGEIGRHIEDHVDGIKSASIKGDHPEDYVENCHIELEIRYDAIRTDRTKICLAVEEFEDIEGNVIKS